MPLKKLKKWLREGLKPKKCLKRLKSELYNYRGIAITLISESGSDRVLKTWYIDR